MAQLMETIARLRLLAPTFVSVTYGAGGSTREPARWSWSTRFKAELGIETMAHLTCVGSSRGELRQTLDRLAGAGIENIMALRGDPPTRGAHVRAGPGRPGPRLRPDRADRRGLRPRASGAPATRRGIPRARTLEHDLANVVRKVAAGAQFLVTQAFFDNVALLRLRRAGPRGGDHRPHHPRDHAHHRPAGDEPDHGARPAHHRPRRPAPGDRAPGGQPGGGGGAGRRLRHLAVRGAAALRAPPGCTSTPSTAPPRPAPSWPRCRSPSPGSTPGRRPRRPRSALLALT